MYIQKQNNPFEKTAGPNQDGHDTDATSDISDTSATYVLLIFHLSKLTNMNIKSSTHNKGL